MKKLPRLFNKFIIWLQQSDLPGKYRFYLLTRNLFKRYAVQYCFDHGTFFIPYAQWCFWDTFGPQNYYINENLPFCTLINKELDSFDFIDLGADVGVMSLLIAIHCSQLNRITAFEPNPHAYQYLNSNANSSRHQFTAVNEAVSNFVGSAGFEFDDSTPSDHEGRINNTADGKTHVITLDSFFKNKRVSKHLAIKIDVEGQEVEVLQGANGLITSCEKCVLFIEIHPDTLKDTGMTPESIFEEAEKIRKMHWLLPDSGKVVNRDIAFFKQFEERQYDIIGVSTTPNL